MAKWYGTVGFNEGTKQTSPGVWEEVVVSRNYYGDIVRNSRRLQSADKLNDDVVVSNELSIVSDPYALQNFHAIRYAEFMGSKWKVTSVEVEYPRLTLSLGGVYTEQSETETSDDSGGDSGD